MSAECFTRPQYVFRSYRETGRSLLPGRDDDMAEIQSQDTGPSRRLRVQLCRCCCCCCCFAFKPMYAEVTDCGEVKIKLSGASP